MHTPVPLILFLVFCCCPIIHVSADGEVAVAYSTSDSSAESIAAAAKRVTDDAAATDECCIERLHRLLELREQHERFVHELHEANLKLIREFPPDKEPDILPRMGIIDLVFWLSASALFVTSVLGLLAKCLLFTHALVHGDEGLTYPKEEPTAAPDPSSSSAAS